MSPLTWVLAGVLVFWVGATLLRTRGLLPESVKVYGPLVNIHTKRGRALLDRIARPRRFWRAWGNIGLGVALVVMVGSLLALLLAAVALVQNPPPASSPLSEPRNHLIIPGLNDFLPPAVAPEIVLGLVIGLVVHEGGHGILCRVEDIDIDSMGVVFLTIVPAGAFVQPDEESQEAADRGGKARMFAAGVTNNFAITILAMLLLLGPVVGSLGVVSGAAVGGTLPGSPAATAGIDGGDVITGVENRSIETNEDLNAVLDNLSTRQVTVDRKSGPSVTVTRSVLVTAIVESGPVPFDLNDTVVAVNGTRVNTTAAFRDALRDRPVATLRTADGRTATAPMGAYVRVVSGGPLSSTVAANASGVVTSVAGERTLTSGDLSDVLDRQSPSETVSVTLYVNGERSVREVTLGESGGEAYLGVYLSPGVSGMEVSDFGVETYPMGRYLGLLGGDCPQCESFGGMSLGAYLYLLLSLPLIGEAGVAALPYNFAGFVGPVANFVTVSGPLSVLGGGVFALANGLFWTAWINVNLAFFNCVPTFLLDGGHILRTSFEGVVSRLPVSNGERLVTAATLAVQLVMLAALAVLLSGGQLVP
ncbi:MAG: site-2 protease family protein [Halobacteriaceae archaeon]